MVSVYTLSWGNSLCPLLTDYLACNYSTWVLFWLPTAEQGQLKHQEQPYLVMVLTSVTNPSFSKPVANLSPATESRDLMLLAQSEQELGVRV